MVFQSYALYPHMTVGKNIAFPLKMAGESQDDIDKKVANAARILNLTNYLDRRPGQLSGGQRQRVAIGRAIVRNPAAFLFDEPLSNLDAALRGSMRLEISELHQQLGKTMIYVTHDQVEAMTMADKIVVLNAGNIEQVGSPLELYRKPKNRFVAGFIGSPTMNFVEGPEVPARYACKTIGVRPEHIAVSRQQVEGVWHGTVGVAEHLGADTFVHVHTDGQRHDQRPRLGRGAGHPRRRGLADARPVEDPPLRRRRPGDLLTTESHHAPARQVRPDHRRRARHRRRLRPGLRRRGRDGRHRRHRPRPRRGDRRRHRSRPPMPSASTSPTRPRSTPASRRSWPGPAASTS